MDSSAPDCFCPLWPKSEVQLSGLASLVLTAPCESYGNLFFKLYYLILASDCPLCVLSSSGISKTVLEKPQA